MKLFETALLHAKAYRILREKVTTLLTPFHLSIPEWVVLSSLLADPNQNLKAIAEGMGVEAAFISGIIHSLEKKELVRIVLNETDRRYKHSHITQSGKELVLCSKSHIETELAKMFTLVESSDMQAHTRVLQAIITSVPSDA